MVGINDYIINNKLQAKRLQKDIKAWLEEHFWESIDVKFDEWVIIEINGAWSNRGIFNVILDIYKELGMPDHINTEKDGTDTTILLFYTSIHKIEGIDYGSDNVDELYEEIVSLDDEDRMELTQRLNKQAMKEFKEDFFRWL